MDRENRTPNRLLLPGVCLAALGWTLPTFAQSTLPAPEKLAEVLCAELQAVRGLYTPEGPLRLQFTLRNTSDRPIDIPLSTPLPASNGIALPLQLALGSGEQRALAVICDDEGSQQVEPAAPPAESAEGTCTLCLAPRGSIGADIDLREYHQVLRYPGSYRVEWRPLGGQLGTVTTQFRVEPRKDAIVVTDHGKITFVLDYDQAPRNVENFLELVSAGFYVKKIFHRLIPGFVIQGGCPKGDGTGIRPDGKLVPGEFHNTRFDLGTLALARKPSDPNSASCQFFIGLGRIEALDGQYTVIGQARDDGSLRTLQKLAALPTDRRDRPLSPITINSINLVDAAETRVRSLELRGGQKSTPATPNTQTSDRQPKRP